MKRFAIALLGLGVTIALAGPASAAAIVDFDPTPSISGGGTIVGGPNFTQDGFYVEAFWATGTGTGSGAFTTAHFHISPDVDDNSENQHWNGGDQLQGIVVELANGAPFSLTSLDYRVSSTSSIIDGFVDAQILISTSFDPTNSVASEFTAFAAGPVSATYSTLDLTGLFDNVTRVWISSSASVSFDNITVITPEPSSLVLLTFGTLGLVVGGSRRRRGSAR